MTPSGTEISIRRKSRSKTERAMQQLQSWINSDEFQVRLAPTVLYSPRSSPAVTLRNSLFPAHQLADTPTHDCIAWFKAYGLNEAIIASLSMLPQPVKCTEPRQTTTKQNQRNPTKLPAHPCCRWLDISPSASPALLACSRSVALSFYLLLAYL